MFVGEAPGKNEDKNGIPFVGEAGQFLDSLLESVGIEREDVFISNVVKCRPSSTNRTPTDDEAQLCGQLWLNTEMMMVQPKIVVTLGLAATSYVLSEYDDTMEHMHNVPLENVQVGAYTVPIVLPIYHPASAIHAAKQDGGGTARIRDIQSGFSTLQKLSQGASVESLIIRDEYPNPLYRTYEFHTAISTEELEGTVALDVETENENLWSVQYSMTPGVACFVPVREWTSNKQWEEALVGRTVLVHNYLFDSQYIDLSRSKVVDTMVMAYLLGLPQSLKTLARNLCGMSMESYEDITRPYRKGKAIAYLELAASTEWPSPVPHEKITWVKKHERLDVKIRKPQHINKKIAKILLHTLEQGADPWGRWHKIAQFERAEVERALGPMPDAMLSDIDFDVALYYSCRDPDATIRVYNAMMPMIQEQGLQFVLDGLDLPTLKVVKAMMDTGVSVERAKLQLLADMQLGPMSQASDELNAITGSSWNPNSDTEVSKYLYGTLGYKPTKFTKTRRPSVDKRELKKLEHPAIAPILAYREALDARARLLGLLDHIRSDNRIHTTFTVTRTATGRLASRDPNIQNIPVRTLLGKRIRAAFHASPSYKLVAADYSQVEMRVLAHVSGCERLTQFFLDGRDIHAETIASIRGISLEEASIEEVRYPAKVLNFGVAYGISDRGLHSSLVERGILGYDVEMCAEFIRDYFRMYPEVKEWQQETIAFARRNGYVKDMWGRRRWTPEFVCPVRRIQEEGKRQAINMPIQSGAQGIVKLAANRIYAQFPFMWMYDSVRWLMQQHDELIWEVKVSNSEIPVDGVAELFKDEMERTVSLSVPTPVDVKVGATWADV